MSIVPHNNCLDPSFYPILSKQYLTKNALMLIRSRTKVHHKVAGFTPTFFLYGKCIDLCKILLQIVICFMYRYVFQYIRIIFCVLAMFA